MKLILATTPEGGIGKNGRLPWDRLEGDLPRFKMLTMGNTVVMGRSTFESLPFRLKGRKEVVITSTPEKYSVDGVTFTNDITPYIGDDCFLIGGASLVDSNWQHVNEIYLTITADSYDCDTYIRFSELIKFSVTDSLKLRDNTYQHLIRTRT